MIKYCTILFYDSIKFEKKKQPISWNYVKEAVRFHSIMLWLNIKKNYLSNLHHIPIIYL